ncbi:hypothetical protein CVT25_010531 [Psilocybe cyanescens]|uniref:Uncharacterized protein n=1 Tax=Psilocybe cyanescens TaxID=93625 RepID=A0A409X2I8_PSICY|nr:hypothetical protein CVT25_010531 [Psilocybe cyanescens]
MPHPHLLISALLNPADEEQSGGPRQAAQVDLRPVLARLAGHRPDTPIYAPSHVVSWLQALVATQLTPPLSILPRPSASGARSSSRFYGDPPTHLAGYPLPPADGHLPEASTLIRINRKTTLSKLYTFKDVGAYIEYPETHPTNPVGYMFRQDVKEWWNPTRGFVYSLGMPSGRTKFGEEVYCDLLVDGTGTKVPCYNRHSTCQGSKLCAAGDVKKWSEAHQTAGANEISQRLAHERAFCSEIADPSHDVFQRTAAFITALRKVGCRAQKHEETILNAAEQQAYAALLAHQADLSRGYVPAEEHCEGRIILEFDQLDKPFVRCEHYNRRGNRDHLISYIDDIYDIDYLDAYFNEDFDELDRIEEAVSRLGYGPLAECSTIANFTSQRKHCPRDHRDEKQQLAQLKMCRLECKVKVHVYEPLPEYRHSCPWTLVVCRGIHTHPIPIPQKTPPSIRAEVVKLLKSLDNDLADLTPRRFIRHPITKSYLISRFPSVILPSLSSLHISLANRSHLKYYIDEVKQELFPAGTGWEGICHLKDYQDAHLPSEEHYIRRVIDLPHDTLDVHDEDEPGDLGNSETENLKIVVCMSKEQSRRMHGGQYMQSDIGFKRVIGFHEFEMTSMDRKANTSVIFCRVFLNRQTAVAHQTVFALIEEIVFEDTGRTVQWRHIHASDLDETDGFILLWTGDQHGGQAKGLGLHLQKIAQRYPEKYDLHEPSRLLALLSPYEHLHRLFRLCVIHGMRNIRKLSISDNLRNCMRSLMCIEHEDWDRAINTLIHSGQKAVIDWVNDKVRSKFAFEAMCWEKSHIPKMIWKAGDKDSNLAEEAHADINREGIHCTLVGGVKKGQAFDNLKITTLQAFEQAGVRPSYLSGHISENLTKNLKRKFNAHHHMLEGQDSKIEQHNKRLQSAYEKLTTARQGLSLCTEKLEQHCPIRDFEQYKRASEALVRGQAKLQRAEIVFEKQVDAGRALQGTGSGKVGMYLPVHD